MTSLPRLRNPFQRRNSSSSLDDEDPEDELDEEQQEKLISKLADTDARQNALYRKLFLSIPLLSALFFLYMFLFASSNARERMTAFLGMSSLGVTAYILHFVPVEEGMSLSTSSSSSSSFSSPRISKGMMEKSPLEKYIVYLNGALVGMMSVAAMVSWRRGSREQAWREMIPGIVFGMSMFARQQLAPLDLEELQKARYELKGA